MSVFAGEYQGGSYVEVLGTQGSNPLSLWKICGPQKNVTKQYDKPLKSYIYISSGGGCKLQIPKDDKSSLGLVQPFLVLQVSLSQVGMGWQAMGTIAILLMAAPAWHAKLLACTLIVC